MVRTGAYNMKIKTKCRFPKIWCDHPHSDDGECDKWCYFNTTDIQTNEEWIKSLNSHDFAIFIAEIMDCGYCKEELHIDCNYSCAIPQWLEQEHKE